MSGVNLNILLLVAGVAIVLFWPKIASLVQDKNNDGFPDMDISSVLRATQKSDCASKLLDAAKCLDPVSQADEKEVLVKAAVKKIMEEK